MKEFYIVSFTDKEGENQFYKGQSFKRAETLLTKGLKQNKGVTYGTFTQNSETLHMKIESIYPTGDPENPKISSDEIDLPKHFLDYLLKQFSR